MQPVNRLPPEILSRIASELMDEHATDARLLIPLTHVCRYWRESIVSTAGNWTLISSERIRLMELSLERCQAAPLQLRLTMWQVEQHPTFTASITPYMQNTETLRIHYIRAIGKLVQALPNFPQSMPNLRSLSLLADSARADQLEEVSSDPLGGPTPPLTHLSLWFIPLYPSLQRLTTLTNLSLITDRFDLHMDVLLDFLEANRALEHAKLSVLFTRPALRDSRRRVGIVNRLRCLSIWSVDAAWINALISRIPLHNGARLEIKLHVQNAGLIEVLSGISATHLSNLQSPTSTECRPDDRCVELLGPNGRFSFTGNPHQTAPFAEFSLFQLTNIKTFRLTRRALGPTMGAQARIAFPPLALPALETLAVEHELDVLHLLSALFADPSAFPSLKTMAFLDCHIDEACMEALTKSASDRKNTTSAQLYRIVIVSPGRKLPGVLSIDRLGEHVPVVDVRMGKKLPADLF